LTPLSSPSWSQEAAAGADTAIAPQIVRFEALVRAAD